MRTLVLSGVFLAFLSRLCAFKVEFKNKEISTLKPGNRDLNTDQVLRTLQSTQQEIPKSTTIYQQSEELKANGELQSGYQDSAGDSSEQTIIKKNEERKNDDSLDDNQKLERKAGEKPALSNPTYQFFLVAVLVFSGVGVFIAISMVIVYLVRRIKDDSASERDTLELIDKGDGRYLMYSCRSASSYSMTGSTYTSHSQLSDDGCSSYGSPEMMSPVYDDVTRLSMDTASQQSEPRRKNSKKKDQKYTEKKDKQKKKSAGHFKFLRSKDDSYENSGVNYEH